MALMFQQRVSLELISHFINNYLRYQPIAYSLLFEEKYESYIYFVCSAKYCGYNIRGQLGIDNTTNMGNNSSEMASLPSINL